MLVSRKLSKIAIFGSFRGHISTWNCANIVYDHIFGYYSSSWIYWTTRFFFISNGFFQVRLGVAQKFAVFSLICCLGVAYFWKTWHLIMILHERSVFLFFFLNRSSLGIHIIFNLTFTYLCRWSYSFFVKVIKVE